jgi:hypothetical protein
MKQPAMRTIELSRGTTQLVAVSPRTILRVQSGTVRLRPPPEWLADTQVRGELRLDAEDIHVVIASGCVELTALANAEMLLIPDLQAPLLAKSAAVVRQMIQALRLPRRLIR